jgi:hypothetical protein
MLQGMKNVPGSDRMQQGKFRHWSAESQEYAPSDALLSYLSEGWKLDKFIAVETFYYSGYRRVDVVHFTLRRDQQSFAMPVLANPMVNRLIDYYELTILPTNVTHSTIES